MKYIIIVLILLGCSSKYGSSGQNCTVTDAPNGALVTCEDGSSEEIVDGEPSPTPSPEPIPEPNKCIVLKDCDKGKCNKKTICYILK